MGNDRRIGVLWVAKGLGPGGMERLLVNHARLGDRDRFTYRAAYVVDRPNSVVGELEELDVPCHRLGPGGGVTWLRDLLALVRRPDIDVVHVHSPLPAAAARPMLRFLPRSSAAVYTEHNTWDCYGRPTRLANAVTYPLDQARFAVSRDAAASAPPWLARRTVVLTHGVDIDRVRSHGPARRQARANLGVSDGEVLVVTVANLRREKAYDVLLDAAAQIVATSPEVRFVSAGQGPLRDELLARRDELGLGDRFRFLGFRQDVLDLVAAADVFALSSRREGLPVAYMEACALGVPSVVTAVGGLPESVRDGIDGRLVEPGSATALSRALLEVVRDPGLRARMAAAASAGAGRFDARHAITEQERVYRQLVAG